MSTTKLGRPTKLTPELAAAIAGLVEKGNDRAVAARVAGIGESTFYAWMERGSACATELERLRALPLAALRKQARAAKVRNAGRKTTARLLEDLLVDELPFLEFRDAIKRADALAETDKIEVIRVAEDEHWQAAAWWLERRYPDRYARPLRQEISGPGGGPVRVSTMTDEELADAWDRLRAAARSIDG